MKNSNQWFVALIIALIGTVVAYSVIKNDNEKLANTRQLQLQNTHNRAISKFTISLGKFAGMVSGMKSFMNLSPELPSAELLQKFVRNQIEDIGYQDSIVVSYVDTMHVFKYSFNKNDMDPANLVGKSVKNLRDSTEIKNLNKLLKSDSLRILSPKNLLEGWVGIPIDFRVHRNGVTTGYVAPLINFKTIIQPIYDNQTNPDYVFRFVASGKYDFDREMVHDGSTVYNQNNDPEYYKNYGIDSASFYYTTMKLYGLEFTIGTAFKNKPTTFSSFSKMVIGVNISFLIFVFLLTYQINEYRSYNRNVNQANLLLKKKQDEISQKNEELSILNSTKDRFFSIIGHDIKGPLHSIEGLLSILLHENIKDNGLKGIISKLQDSVKNTLSLLNNLLNWARSQTGDLTFTKTQFNIKEAINEVLTVLHPNAEAKQIEIKFNPKSDIPFSGDLYMFQTIIRNLVSNALKFTPEKGKVEISVDTSGNALLIKVIDNGVGMENVSDKIFGIGGAQSTEGTLGELGTGLGLMLCKEFVDKHHGVINVTSKVGVGTTFTVQLPIQ